MKKFVASLLAVMMVLSVVCFASAEVREYVAYAYADTQGNVLTTEVPEIYAVIDDEAMTATFVNEAGEEAAYELTVSNQNDEAIAFTFVDEDGATQTMAYAIADDQITLVDTENGVLLLFVNVEALTEAAE